MTTPLLGTIWFPDVSNWQAGLTVQPGTVAVIAKATQGTNYQDASFENFRGQATAQGSVFSGYHFLIAGNAAAQADYYHAFAGNTPCMLDVETEAASNPTVDDCIAFINRLTELGGRVWGVYFPKWYWQKMGGDLSAITVLGTAIISSYYTTYSDTGPGWASYGGATPTVWQYANNFSYAGRSIDFNAFRGTVAQFAALVNGTPGSVVPVVSLAILDMCARSDPSEPQGQTTNFNTVYPVQLALVKKGLLDDADKRWGRGSFGTLTVAAYSAWQKSLGYSGGDADGVPGSDSLRRLASATGSFHVVA